MAAILAALAQASGAQVACGPEGGYVYSQLLDDFTTSNTLSLVLWRDTRDARHRLGIDLAGLGRPTQPIYPIKNGWIASFHLGGEPLFSLVKAGIEAGSHVAAPTTYHDAWGAKLDALVTIDGLVNAGGRSILYEWGGDEAKPPPDEVIVTSTCANLIVNFQYGPRGRQWDSEETTRAYLETMDSLTEALGAGSRSTCTWVLTGCAEDQGGP
ncbi:hypothetical protein [Stagnihabitans tardus]|uniref:Uncharacterized protein n=1 Tax=Stagnihabitans tardus TaxID=2699202 RepID=A0AAE4YCI4_9RHOB|nr:hypothetical protein [Stagnihabitans tardus]NBZ87445.1 hypothetical protein [Stagnihabitans tardus]